MDPEGSAFDMHSARQLHRRAHAILLLLVKELRDEESVANRATSAGPTSEITRNFWSAMILPSIEQEALYLQIVFGQGTAVGGNLAVIGTALPFWRCPSDYGGECIQAVPIVHPPFELASGNYCGSEGILDNMSHVRIAEIVDGTSNTLLLGERLVQPGVNGFCRSHQRGADRLLSKTV